ncbi:nuclear transport factor 2 family protein [Pseudorhodoferax sp. LjRoot39]|uniref:nuclear transport factor 2 family protein n=1 Tax=Pseudorhodoferax sp. LjRoot39 TaxID=3342328 RepID=UPI003ED00335
MDKQAIEAFLHAQVAAWNRGDKVGFFAAYRAAAPNGLRIEYVGRAEADGWPVLEQMWEHQSAKVEIEEVVTIVNGAEAACHNRNKLRGADRGIETVEIYRFDAGVLQIRYFILGV